MADSLITDIQESIHKKQNSNILATFLDQVVDRRASNFDSALESTSLSNDTTSNTSEKIEKPRVVAMVDIERDISQIGQDYVDSFGKVENSDKNSEDSIRSNSPELRKNYHDIEAMKRGCPASASGRFVLNTGVSSLVDEMMCQFENLKTTHKV